MNIVFILIRLYLVSSVYPNGHNGPPFSTCFSSFGTRTLTKTFGFSPIRFLVDFLYETETEKIIHSHHSQIAELKEESYEVK